MKLSQFFLSFLAIAMSSSATATHIEEELLVKCEGTPGIMGLGEIAFFGLTFIATHNAANAVSNDDGIELDSAAVTEQEWHHSETMRANLRANSPPNVGTNGDSTDMRVIIKGGCSRCRRSLAATSPAIRADFSVAFTAALRASNYSYFHSNNFKCTMGPIEMGVPAAE